MSLDLASVLVMTALVVNVSGVLFILETMLRRDEGAGRVWAVGFLGAMLTTLAYMIWAVDDGAWWAIAVGNATFVGGTGCMWLGCRRFNGRRMTWSALLVAAAGVGAGISVVIEGAEGGDWAGAVWMFVSLLVFAGAGAVECVRGALGESRTAWVLGAVLGFQSLFFVARTIAFVAVGPDSEVFQSFFGTVTTSYFTVTLTIVAVVVTSVLRATRAPMRGYLRHAESAAPPSEGIVGDADFARSLASLCRRAESRGEAVAVIAVRIDDLEQISTAFGSDVAGGVTEAWRAGVQRHAPTNALVGEDGATGLVVGLAVASAQEARRHAASIYRGLFDDLGRVGGGIIPVVGVGVGLSDAAGYRPDEILRAAREIASRAAATVETSVLVGDAE